MRNTGVRLSLRAELHLFIVEIGLMNSNNAAHVIEIGRCQRVKLGAVAELDHEYKVMGALADLLNCVEPR